ncbi:hypothetical protein ES703_77119 [subsurface metagenome]
MSIPQNIADKIMFSNNHTCCICRIKGKHVQIHHIDGDSSNNTMENLAILCLECHSKVTSNEGFGRSYTAGEVKQYKRTWEFMVRKTLIGEERETSSKEGISFFDQTASEILAMNDGDPRISEKLEMLANLNIIVGCTDEILGTFFHLAVISSMSQKQTAAMLARHIYELFPHLVGPDMVPLDADDEHRLEQGVKLLGTIGWFNGEFSKDIEVVRAACDNLYNMCEIAVLYDSEEIGVLIASELQKIKDACLTIYEEEKKPFRKGSQYVDRTVKKMRQFLKQQNVKWSPPPIKEEI